MSLVFKTVIPISFFVIWWIVILYSASIFLVEMDNQLPLFVSSANVERYTLLVESGLSVDTLSTGISVHTLWPWSKCLYKIKCYLNEIIIYLMILNSSYFMSVREKHKAVVTKWEKEMKTKYYSLAKTWMNKINFSIQSFFR